MAGYGTVGLHVGPVGRWLRLAWGLLILIPIGVDLYENASVSFSLAFWGQALMFVVLLSALYTAVYYALVERFLARANPWVNTAIFVGPTLLVGWWNVLAPDIARLPSELTVAMAAYIGLSFLLEWRITYGGCEVVSLPIVLLKRRYVTYCIPLVAVDAAEKKSVETSERARRLLWLGVLAGVVVLLTAWAISPLL